MQHLQQFITRLKWLVGFYVLLALGVFFVSILGSAGDMAARLWNDWLRPSAHAQIVSIEALCRVSASRNLIPHEGPGLALVPCEEAPSGVRVASRNDRVRIVFEEDGGRRIEAVVPRRELGLSLNAKAGDTLRVSYDLDAADPKPRVARADADLLFIASCVLPALFFMVLAFRSIRWVIPMWLQAIRKKVPSVPVGKEGFEAFASAIERLLARRRLQQGPAGTSRSTEPAVRPGPAPAATGSAHVRPPSQRAPTVRRASWWG